MAVSSGLKYAERGYFSLLTCFTFLHIFMAYEPHLACHLDAFLDRLARERAVLVSVLRVRGSVPREAGTWMAVFADVQVGTIGGGQLEWDALRQARLQLAGTDLAPW